ncbi:MAG: small basic family protein [Thermoanaerobacteraceae bacterium]|nr:small basic family protein [Thermoanaerobacteraceae bacterium]
MVLFPILGIIAGILLGLFLPVNISAAYAPYLSIAILASLDSVLGGARANMEKNFDINIFMSGFISNSMVAAGLAYIGDLLGVPIYLAAIFVFGSRIFNNIAIIRRYFISSFQRNKRQP